MASISSSANGLRTIQFVAIDGKRRSIRLGKVPMKTAEEIKRRVEYLAAAVGSGTAVDADTTRWLASIGDDLHQRLAAVGLVAPRALAVEVRLKEFIDGYIGSRTDIKPLTTDNLQVCADRMIGFFGADRPIAQIRPGDADEFCAWLRTDYAQATAARTIGRAKQFFRAALRKKLISENPFAECKAGHQHNKDRAYFIPLEDAYKVLEACPGTEWRLLFALSRFGGLRFPSETLALEWPDVDWERSRFLVRSPKTEHHEGGAERWVPIFPELRPYLEDAFEQAEDGAVHVINRCRRTRKNLRERLMGIIRKAGLTPWPRLFHNLRATRQTELAARFPLHVVCAWLGNKQIIAADHYLQVTDADFQRGAESGAVVVQNPVQQVTALDRTDSQSQPEVIGTATLSETLRLGANPSPQTQASAEDWFAGFRHGAAEAREGGYRQWVTGPSSLRSMAVPVSGPLEPPPPPVAAHPGPEFFQQAGWVPPYQVSVWLR
jgi:integrase